MSTVTSALRAVDTGTPAATWAQRPPRRGARASPRGARWRGDRWARRPWPCSGRRTRRSADGGRLAGRRTVSLSDRTHNSGLQRRSVAW